MSYTYVIMHLSPSAYEEIAEKMRAAGYGHAFHEPRNRSETVIDMHGLAVAAGPADLHSPVDNPDRSADDPCDGIVAGDYLGTTLNVFKLRARRLIEQEQERVAPDNALIDFLCNAVRLAREHAAAMTAPIQTEQTRLREENAEWRERAETAERERDGWRQEAEINDGWCKRHAEERNNALAQVEYVISQRNALAERLGTAERRVAELEAHRSGRLDYMSHCTKCGETRAFATAEERDSSAPHECSKAAHVPVGHGAKEPTT